MLHHYCKHYRLVGAGGKEIAACILTSSCALIAILNHSDTKTTSKHSFQPQR